MGLIDILRLVSRAVSFLMGRFSDARSTSVACGIFRPGKSK